MSKVYTLSEMRTKNKEAGLYFFQKGNPKVEGKYGNYLVTKGMGEGYVIYRFFDDGHTELIDNPNGEYSWQPYSSKSDAVNYAKKLNQGNK